MRSSYRLINNAEFRRQALSDTRSPAGLQPAPGVQHSCCMQRRKRLSKPAESDPRCRFCVAVPIDMVATVQRAWISAMTSAIRSGGMPVSEPGGFAASPNGFRIAPSIGQMLIHWASA